jgi:hypothetical protein
MQSCVGQLSKATKQGDPQNVRQNVHGHPVHMLLASGQHMLPCALLNSSMFLLTLHILLAPHRVRQTTGQESNYV